MKAVAAVLVCAFAAAAARPVDPNNMAFLAPHVLMQELAIPFTDHHMRKLLGDCGDKSISFSHGVASGDPLPDAVVIWTRVTPSVPTEDTWPIKYEVATSSSFDKGSIVNSGVALTTQDVDFTCKVDIKGLQPKTQYYYRFTGCGGKTVSPVGKTLTAPAYGSDVDSVRMATVSCSNYQNGFFNAYERMAERGERGELDFWMHLGDYIYEGAINNEGRALGREVMPNKEIITLTDYRQRYQTYHTDEKLQRLRKAIALLAVPDDHEVANNSYATGAAAHNPATEGPYSDRKAAALRAYFEWISVRPFSTEDRRLYRSFTYGNLVKLMLLDTRYEGRDPLPTSREDTLRSDGSNYEDWKQRALQRRIMTDTQMSWLVDNLQSSSQTWNVLGNQKVFTDTTDIVCTKEYSAGTDNWVSYKRSVQDLLKGIIEGGVKNVVFNGGDSHSNWIFEVEASAATEYLPQCSGDPIAVEFAGTGVTSGTGGYTIRQSSSSDEEAEKRIADSEAVRYGNNENLILTDIDCWGYFVSEYKPEAVYVKYYCVDTVKADVDGERMSWDVKTCNGLSRVLQANDACP